MPRKNTVKENITHLVKYLQSEGLDIDLDNDGDYFFIRRKSDSNIISPRYLANGIVAWIEGYMTRNHETKMEKLNAQ